MMEQPSDIQQETALFFTQEKLLLQMEKYSGVLHSSDPPKESHFAQYIALKKDVTYGITQRLHTVL